MVDADQSVAPNQLVIGFHLSSPLRRDGVEVTTYKESYSPEGEPDSIGIVKLGSLNWV